MHKLEGVNEDEEMIQSVPNWNMNDFWTLSVHDGEKKSAVRSLFPLETSGGHLVGHEQTDLNIHLPHLFIHSARFIWR